MAAEQDVKYTLHYFNFDGKGQLIRMLFVVAGVEYEDSFYCWHAKDATESVRHFDNKSKDLMPLGKIPVLEVDGEKFCQQSSIARFLARRFGLMGKDEMEAFKVDMVLETFWDDIAASTIMLHLGNDEEEKMKLKSKLQETLPKLMARTVKWIKGDFVLGDKLSLADLAIYDTLCFVNKVIPDLDVPSELMSIKKNVEEDPKVMNWLNSK